jgi:hypothetical protein
MTEKTDQDRLDELYNMEVRRREKEGETLLKFVSTKALEKELRRRAKKASTIEKWPTQQNFSLEPN